MSVPHGDRPDLPECMTWRTGELPEEIAAQVELWDGRVVWMRRGPAEHQTFTNRIWAAWSGAFAQIGRTIRSDACGSPPKPTSFWEPPARTTSPWISSYTAASTSHIRTSAPPTSCWSVRCCRRATPKPTWKPNEPGTRRPGSLVLGGITGSFGERHRLDPRLRSRIHTRPAAGRDRLLRQANYLLAGEWTPADDAASSSGLLPIAIDWADLAY